MLAARRPGASAIWRSGYRKLKTHDDSHQGHDLDLWERAAKGKVVMGGSHLAFPGMGRIEKRSEGFAWVALDGKTQH